MKSDVIRKRARHDARRGTTGGTVSETPSASPGASRRASPTADTPTLAPDSSTAQLGYPDNDYTGQGQSELMGALGNHQNGQLANDGSYVGQFGFNTNFPGPYHPDSMHQQMYSSQQDAFSFSTGDSSDYDGSETRSNKRRRMSNDSASEPPSSAVSYSSFSDFSNASSATSHSQRSMDFPFSESFSHYSLLRSNFSNGSWHPPMLPPPDNSPQCFIHPPMLPPSSNGHGTGEDNTMDFLHHSNAMQQDDTDSLFATYLHPPMLPPDESPKMSMGSLQVHPPMLPNDWSGSSGHEYFDATMQAY